MASERDIAVVLRVRRWSETSQIVTLFGRRLGVVRCLAKGALRRTKAGKGKFDGGMDLLDAGEMVLSVRPERELQAMTEWSLADGHLPLRGDLRAIWLGMYAAELLGVVLQEFDPQPALFDRTARLLGRLATGQREEVSVAHTIEVLRHGGVLPELERCVRSGRRLAGTDRGLLMSARLGGVVLPEAAAGVYDARAVDPDLLRLLQGLVRLLGSGRPARLPRLTPAEANPLHRILAAHASEALTARLRVPRFFLPPADVPAAPRVPA